MPRFQIKTLLLANVEVTFDVEAGSEEAARVAALDGEGQAIATEIDWESADFQQVLVDGVWVNTEEVQ